MNRRGRGRGGFGGRGGSRAADQMNEKRPSSLAEPDLIPKKKSKQDIWAPDLKFNSLTQVFENSIHAQTLCLHIIQESLGDICADISQLLFENGELHLFGLSQKFSEKFQTQTSSQRRQYNSIEIQEILRRGLLSLILNNIVIQKQLDIEKQSESEEAEQVVLDAPLYKIVPDLVLFRVLLPKMIQMAGDRHDLSACENSQLSTDQHLNNFLFLNHFASNLLLFSATYLKACSVLYNLVVHGRASYEQIIQPMETVEDDQKEVMLEMKRACESLLSEQWITSSQIPNVGVIREKRFDGPMLQIDYAKFILRFLCQKITEFITAKHGRKAGIIMNYVMDIAEPSLDLMSASSDPFTLDQVYDIVEREAVENHVSETEIRKILGQLAIEKLLSKYGSAAHTSYTVQFKYIIRLLAHISVESIIEKRYSKFGLRTYKILQEKKNMDEKQIEKEALIPTRTLKGVLGGMLKDNIVKLQEVPRGSDRSANKTFFLWTLDPHVSHTICNDIFRSAHHLLEKMKALEMESQRLSNRRDLGALLSPEEEATLEQYQKSRALILTSLEDLMASYYLLSIEAKILHQK